MLKAIKLKDKREIEDVEVAVDTIEECTKHLSAMTREDFVLHDTKNARALAKLSKQYGVFLKYYNLGCFTVNIESFKTLHAPDLLREIPETIEACEKRFGPIKTDEKQK